MPRALFTATVMSHLAQFHGPAIALLREQGWQVDVAARDNLAEKNGLVLPEVERAFDVPFERNPLHRCNVRAARDLARILGETKYDLIHCNTPVAGVLTRLLAQRARAAGARLVYTAHGFHFYRGAPLRNWLAYYPLEWALAFLTDVLVTINTEDHARAKRFPARRVVYVPGVGVDVDKFASPRNDVAEVRKGLGLPTDAFVVLSVGELNDNKNHRTIIRALAQLDDPTVHYLICGNGPRREQLAQLTSELGVDARTHFLGYRRDVPDMLAASDVFCLPSFREGLPLSVMEAMAAGKPVVCSRIRGAEDLIQQDVGGSIVDRPGDVNGFADALRGLVSDAARRTAFGAHNRRRVEAFSTGAVFSALRGVYGLDPSAALGRR